MNSQQPNQNEAADMLDSADIHNTITNFVGGLAVVAIVTAVSKLYTRQKENQREIIAMTNTRPRIATNSFSSRFSSYAIWVLSSTAFSLLLATVPATGWEWWRGIAVSFSLLGFIIPVSLVCGEAIYLRFRLDELREEYDRLKDEEEKRLRQRVEELEKRLTDK